MLSVQASWQWFLSSLAELIPNFLTIVIIIIIIIFIIISVDLIGSIPIAEATFSGTWQTNVASNAIDGDLTTVAHSTCGKGVLLWLKLDFSREYCVETVRIMQSNYNLNRKRMDGMEIYVTNDTAEGKCGDLYTTKGSNLEGTKSSKK